GVALPGDARRFVGPMSLGSATMPGMRIMRPFGIARSESGAIAVVMAIVVTAVLLPLTIYGVNSYVRGGVNGELQRGGDAGALAGASRIPLGDPTQVAAVLAAMPVNPTPDQAAPLVNALLAGCTTNCSADVASQVCTAAL